MAFMYARPHLIWVVGSVFQFGPALAILVPGLAWGIPYAWLYGSALLFAAVADQPDSSCQPVSRYAQSALPGPHPYAAASSFPVFTFDVLLEVVPPATAWPRALGLACPVPGVTPWLFTSCALAALSTACSSAVGVLVAAGRPLPCKIALMGSVGYLVSERQ